MNRKPFWLKSFVILSAMLALSLGYIQAQLTGYIPVFVDELGTEDVSVIFQNLTTGNIGIGTTDPGVAKLRVVTVSPISVLGLVTDPTGDNTGVYGQTDSSGNRTAGVFGVATAASGSTTGVWGRSVSSSDFATGVFGEATGSTGLTRGVWGRTSTSSATGSAAGVFGEATGLNTNGIWGRANNGSNAWGVVGESTDGYGVRAISITGNGVWGSTGNPGRSAIYAQSAGGLAANLGVFIDGRLVATGTKSAVVPIQGGQQALMYAEESTEVWFSDYGSATLENGRAEVRIDPEFLQTVNTDKEYHVFLSAKGNPNGVLYVDNETPTSFEILENTGTANIKVSYRIVAKRKDFAEERLKKVNYPSAERKESKE